MGSIRPDVFERVRLERLLQVSSSRRLVPQLTRKAIAEINASVARRSRGSVSEECVTGYVLRSGSAAVGAHGIPDMATCFPNWVRKDLEEGGLTEFEPTGHSEEKGLPIHWKGMTVRIQNGIMVRTHEITNSGKPIFDGIQRPGHSSTWKSADPMNPKTICITFYNTR